jgi:hypothetical protein
MKIKYAFMIFMCLALFVSGCQQTQGQGLKEIPTPQNGEATVTGRIITASDSKPIAKMAVHLAKIVRNGDQAAFYLDTASSPSAISDENGYFVVVKVPAGEYAFVVGDPESLYKIIPDDKDKAQAKIWTAAAEKILDMGTIPVDFSSQ